MTYLKFALLCAAPIAFITAADAANLNVTQGEVLVSRGAGFQALSSSAELAVGDTVIAQPGSVAKVAFADCTIPLNVGTVFRVGKLSPCTTHSAGAGASGATETPTDAPPPQADDHKNLWPYALGAAAVGGIVAVAVSVGGGGDDDGGSSGGGGGDGGNTPPASP